MLDAQLPFLIRIFRAIIGVLLGLIGVALQQNGSEAWALFFYLSGLAAGIPGGAAILVKLFFVGAYFALIATFMWLTHEDGELTFFDVFRAHGPDWWRYFWWVPVSIIIALIAFGVAMYKQFDETDAEIRSGSRELAKNRRSASNESPCLAEVLGDLEDI